MIAFLYKEMRVVSLHHRIFIMLRKCRYRGLIDEFSLAKDLIVHTDHIVFFNFVQSFEIALAHSLLLI